MRLDEVGVGGLGVAEGLAVAEGFDDAEVAGDAGDGLAEDEGRGAELRERGEADAGVKAGEHGSEADGGAVVAGGLEDGEGLAVEEAGAAEAEDGTAEVFERVRGGDEALEAGVVLQDFEGEAAGGGFDAGSGDSGVERRDDGRRVDGCAEREGVLEEEEVADLGERWRRGVGKALQRGERAERGGLQTGFEGSCDEDRIARAAADDGSGAGGGEEAEGAGFAGGGGGGVGLEEGVGGLLHFGGGDLVEAVVAGDVAVLDEVVGAAEDADAGAVEGEPLDGVLPGGAEDGHGDGGGAADVHGAGVDGDEEVGKAEERGDLGDGGAAGERGAVGGGEGADAVDGEGTVGGAEEDGGVAEGLDVADDGGEAVVVPGGGLRAAALDDEGGDGAGGWVGFGEEGAGGG